MKVVYLLLAASLMVALVFLALFIRAVKQGQYDDTWSPSRRILTDDEPMEKMKKEEEGINP